MHRERAASGDPTALLAMGRDVLVKQPFSRLLGAVGMKAAASE